MTLLSSKDDYLQKYIEAVKQRTPINIQNEQGFDFTIGSPLRAFGEGHAIVSAISQDTTEEECKKQARETLFILAGVETFPASKANGILEITSTQSLTITEGTAVFSTDTGNRVGEIVADVEFTGAETLDITMIADESGADITFSAGTLFITDSNQSGTNLLLIDNGTDEETDYERTLRVKDALKAKAHGTAQALITTANNVVLKDGSGIVIESVKNVFMSFPWKHEDPQTLDPDRVGEILMSIQSSIGVPSQTLIDAIQLELTGDDELDGKQGAGQNVVMTAVSTEDITFTVPYKKLTGYVHADIETQIQILISAYIANLTQGESINPTDWQGAISGVNKPDGVDYYDEPNLLPSSIQTIDQFKIWNVTLITVSEI